MSDDKREEIARLNDQFRRAEREDVRGTFLVTSGLNEHALSSGRSPLDVLAAVGAYSDFSEDNDPYGERDFGSFEYLGQRCFWKIDYFADENMEWGAEHPEDPSRSYRVLTIMLAIEY